MADSVTDKDLSQVVELLEESRRDCPPLGLPSVVYELLGTLIRCDHVCFNDYVPAQRRYVLDQDGSDTLVDPSYGDEDPDPFWLHFWDCPPCSYSVTSGDERTVTTTSDFYTQRQWHDTAMYADCLSRYRVDHSAVVCMSSPAGHSRRIVLFRSGNTDYDRRDRLLLALLRPHLDELYQDLQRRRQPELGLTRRQRQLLRLVAAGYSNSEIARELFLSAATVRTHLEKIFKQLHVTNRSAATAKAFPAAPL